MAVPDFQSLMLPILQIASDEQEHSGSETSEKLAKKFGLSESDLNEKLPSGRQSRFTNRIAWARVHLKGAGFLESTGRGLYRITPLGVKVVRENPPLINLKFLSQFSEYQKFRSLTRSSQKPEEIEPDEDKQTPEELLEQSYLSLRRSLARDLLERVKMCTPQFFENLVVDLLVAMGYGGSHKDAGKAVGQSGDGGIDGIIKEDKLGLDVVYIQAKRWEGNVSRPVVQGFAGSLEGQRARKGVLITTSGFSQDAKEYVKQIEKKIVLIDGEQLAQHMIDFGVGVAEVSAYVVKRIDLDYFSEE